MKRFANDSHESLLYIIELRLNCYFIVDFYIKVKTCNGTCDSFFSNTSIFSGWNICKIDAAS